MSRTTNINELPTSAAVRALNPGIFGNPGVFGVGAPEKVAPVAKALPEVAAKFRLRQDRKGPNKTEAEFEAWLRGEWNDRALIHPQGVTLMLANGVRYTPDFVVSFVSHGLMARAPLNYVASVIHAYETKGFMRDDAAVKVKVAARLFPWIKFHLVTKKRKKDGGGWAIEEVLP